MFFAKSFKFFTVWRQKWQMYCRSGTCVVFEMVYDVPNVLAAIHLCHISPSMQTRSISNPNPIGFSCITRFHFFADTIVWSVASLEQLESNQISFSSPHLLWRPSSKCHCDLNKMTSSKSCHCDLNEMTSSFIKLPFKKHRERVRIESKSRFSIEKTDIFN